MYKTRPAENRDRMNLESGFFRQRVAGQDVVVVAAQVAGRVKLDLATLADDVIERMTYSKVDRLVVDV